MERVDLIVSVNTFWKIVAAIVVGCAIYDLILWSFETVAKGAPDLLRDFRREVRSRFVEYRPLARARRGLSELWQRHVLDKDVERYAARIVTEPPERTPAAAWCLNEATRTLHLSECRYSGSCTPWYWASSIEEARYFAREQGLKVGCSCKPVGDLSTVGG